MDAWPAAAMSARGPAPSLRTRPTPRAERYAFGKGLRRKVRRSSLGDWLPPPGRRDPVDQVVASHEGRLERLIPIRVGRMIASPYGFLRGTAGVMAEDFSSLPATGIAPVICGDAHIGNFGFYASPERRLVLDLNDFDEAHPGAWEWDLRRLTVSIWVAGRLNGFVEDHCETAARSCVAAYRRHLRHLADEPLFSRSFDHLGVGRLKAQASAGSLRAEIDRAAGKAQKRTSDRALPRFTEYRKGERRLVDEPPLITRTDIDDGIVDGLDDYLLTLAPHWRRILGGYTVVDVVHKAVGVGSVGLRAYVALCEGDSTDDVVFLQLKQARRSVIARFVHGDAAWHAHQGQRVVEYQQTLQTASDPLLGWMTASGHQYYVRQFRNMKGAIAVDSIGHGALVDYSAICARLLAKGHARTSGASMIAGYLGKSEKADVALCRFARAYADQTERDHQALINAVRRGVLPADSLT